MKSFSGLQTANFSSIFKLQRVSNLSLDSYRALIPFMRTPPFKSHLILKYPIKAPSPNTITLKIGFPQTNFDRTCLVHNTNLLRNIMGGLFSFPMFLASIHIPACSNPFLLKTYISLLPPSVSVLSLPLLEHCAQLTRLYSLRSDRELYNLLILISFGNLGKLINFSSFIMNLLILISSQALKKFKGFKEVAHTNNIHTYQPILGV